LATRDRVMKAFREALDIEDNVDTSTLVYRVYPAWTSMGHMALVAALEVEFDVLLETDEILAMSNFDKVLEVMNKYSNQEG
jgi:acyl carrier protein